jgi:hypothetical protein
VCPEISELLDRQAHIGEDDGFDFDKEVEAIVEPVTKKGDLIELGRHRLLCGDSSNADDIKRLFSDGKACLLHTDPPYNVDYYGGNRPHGKARPKKCRHWCRRS